MPAHTTMTFYTGMVLECQHCYRICRWEEATTRQNCPSCGLDIGNWQVLTEELKSRLAPTSETPSE